ncbi:hydroxyacid dehydrogenase [Candidatus Peregrinibacteria bacterium]|nr:hydroxyacid dehydrogenase [Candidatus Peregrinibacteria bacterium]
MKNKNSFGKIYFFETEKSEERIVKNAFPKAEIVKEPFTVKNASKFKDAEIFCVMIDSVLDAANLKKCPNLKLIATRTVGYNHIDLKYASKKGIKVCNVPDYGSHVIAEHVFALLLASIRNVLEGENRTAHQKFSWKGLKGIALQGKTLGVIGTGKIGLNVCRIGSLGFLMNVIAFDVHRDEEKALENHFKYVDSLDEIWKNSNVISLHVPLFPETKHLINEKTIKKMKDGVVLINTARGGLIDTKALIKAVKAGKFSDVALDVLEHETNIKEDKELLQLPGVIITPHIAFYADDSIICMYKEAIRSINSYLKKETVLLHEVKGC